jgi:hypothetical protein
MFVSKDFVKLAIMSIAAAALLSSICFAADETQAVEQPKPSVVKVQGVVSVTTDANDVITKVVLVTEDEDYNVVLDAKGLELGKMMEGEKVEVQGVVEDKSGELWLTVQSYKAIEEASETE